MLILGHEMSPTNNDGRRIWRIKYRTAYVNLAQVNMFRIISADCFNAEGEVEWWSLFMFVMADGSEVVISVDNPDKVTTYLLQNSL